MIIKIYQNQYNNMKVLSLSPHTINCIDPNTGRLEWKIDHSNYQTFRILDHQGKVHDFDDPSKREIGNYKTNGSFVVLKGDARETIDFFTYDRVGVDSYETNMKFSFLGANKSLMSLKNRSMMTSSLISGRSFGNDAMSYHERTGLRGLEDDPLLGKDMRKIVKFLRKYFLKPINNEDFELYRDRK